MSRQNGMPAFNQVPPSILNEKVGTMSAQLALDLEKLLNNLLELGHGFCIDVWLSDCAKNVDRIYPEGRKPSVSIYLRHLPYVKLE